MFLNALLPDLYMKKKHPSISLSIYLCFLWARCLQRQRGPPYRKVAAIWPMTFCVPWPIPAESTPEASATLLRWPSDLHSASSRAVNVRCEWEGDIPLLNFKVLMIQKNADRYRSNDCLFKYHLQYFLAWCYECFSLCDFSRRGTTLETCPYMAISAFQWYPTQINGHKFRGRNADFFQLPDTLLAVPAVLTADCGNLSRIQLTEFRTEHWFLTNDTTNALNGKVGKRWDHYTSHLHPVVYFFPPVWLKTAGGSITPV